MIAYRYNDRQYAHSDEFGNVTLGAVRLELSKYNVVKTTAKGFWIDYAFGKKFIKLTNKKQFAHLDKEAALKSFIKRKERQISILKARLVKPEIALDMARSCLETS